MTGVGFIDLNGKLIKVGGLERKLCGAKRAGMRMIIVPKENCVIGNDYVVCCDNVVDVLPFSVGRL